MRPSDQRRALAAAVQAARAAGSLMRRNWHTAKIVHTATRHDLKIELDVRCQRTIQTTLHRSFPDIALLGEEGVSGHPKSPLRWVVDPIDGTVNFAYGIPHACTSIALQQRLPQAAGWENADFQTLLGVVYDPFCDELWTGLRGQPARLNGRIIHASQRRRLAEAVVALGFGKRTSVLQTLLPELHCLALKVRKIRILGAAALDLAYVATGRLEAFVESGLRLWDIAAAGLILECAGGDFFHQPLPGRHTYRVMANNGLLRRSLQQALRPRR